MVCSCCLMYMLVLESHSSACTSNSWNLPVTLVYAASLASLGVENGALILMSAPYQPIQNFGAPCTMLVRTSTGSGALAVPSGSRAITKERFTLTEMYSLVEGMELYGLKWARIHKECKDLENKTQGDLKDKWRNWQRNVANGWSTARVYMPDELKLRIEKLVTDHATQQQSAHTLVQHARGLLQPGSEQALAAAMSGNFQHLHSMDPSQLMGLGLDPSTIAQLTSGMHHSGLPLMYPHDAGGMEAHMISGMRPAEGSAADGAAMGMAAGCKAMSNPESLIQD
eukprot:363670-Chlamydomonas_euryale.AAC.14